MTTPRSNTRGYWDEYAEASRWSRPDESGRTWRQPNPELFKPWAAEPLDGCECGCGGNVQRWARHRADLGTLDGTPLSINTHEQQMSPRLAGPGPISLALDTAITARERARS